MFCSFAARRRSRQLSACATAMAASRFPTPDGPAKIMLGGSVPRSTERESRSMSRRWLMTSRNGIGPSLPAFLLWRFLVLLLLLLLVAIAADAEDARPEPALLLRRFDGRRRRRIGGAGGGRRRGGRQAGVFDSRRLRLLLMAEQPGDPRHQPARRVNIAVGCRLGAADKIFGIDHRSVLDGAVVVDHLDV